MRKLVGVIGVIENAIALLFWVSTVREYSKGGPSGIATWLVFLSSLMVGLIAVFFFLVSRRDNLPSLLFAISLLGGVASLWIGLRGLPFFNPMILIHPLYAAPVLNCVIALASLASARMARTVSAN